MSEKKRSKAPAPLSLNATKPTDCPDSSSGIIGVDNTKEIATIQKAITDVEGDKDITYEQKRNLISFLNGRLILLEKYGEVKEQHIERYAELGFGNGGVVLKVEHKPTGMIMARKMIMLDIKPAVRTQIMRELKVLHECNWPYIVGYYGSFCLNNEISIFMQHMDGGSLDLIMKAGRIPVEMISRITESVLKGEQYLHNIHQIIHRDVKPSNILVNTLGEIKLCDFGVSGQLVNSMANSFVGTRSYMAPERLQGIEYSILSDIWSLGISLIEMALGRYPIPQPPLEEIVIEMQTSSAGTLPPREGGNPYASSAHIMRMPIFELLQIITTSKPPTLPDKFFSQDFRDFVDKCLQKQVNQREDIETLLGQPFLRNLIPCSEFASWVQRSVEANTILEKQE